MIRLKYRKILFLVLIALMTGVTMAAYSQSHAGFLTKTFAVVMVQQVATVVLFLVCFGWDLGRSRPSRSGDYRSLPFE
ncbi:MAG: hypothetical protein IGR76_00795 [Synechococcales cyanobacterium T60_A2020_003]|nr:hypothetical protein [Synechococcales cyanobacterium T60_A2020_003]